MAEVDPDLKRLIAPAADSQRKRFRNEGHFNALIGSLRSVDGTHLQVERSTYYDAFRTAMSADYELFGVSFALDRHQQEDGMYLNYLAEFEEELGVTAEQVVDDVEFAESSDER